MSELKAGKVVHVYHDPVDCENFEGLAYLVKDRQTRGYQQEYWTVKFKDDGFVTERWVNTIEH